MTQTLKLQKRPVLDFPYQAVKAHRAGNTGPTLIAEG